MLAISFDKLFDVTVFDNMVAYSIVDALISIGFAFLIGLFISIVYKKTFSGVMYSMTFGVTLVALTMITSLIVLSVTSLAISLSMLGAMSIIRFRTAVKDPLDIVYLFWSIGCGIVIGAGMIPLALIGSIIIGVILLIFVNRKTFDNPYILIIDCTDDAAEKAAIAIVEKSVKRYKVKSHTVSGDSTELTLEVRLGGNNSQFVRELSKTENVIKAVLVSYNGDYMS